MKNEFTKTAVFEVLVYDALNRQRFDTIADLTDAVKTLAAKYRIDYDSDVVAKAIRSVNAKRSVLR